MLINRFSPPAYGWRPVLGEFDRMRRELDRLFDAVAGVGPTPSRGKVYPPVNLSHDDECYYLRAEVPGIPIDKLEVTAANNSIVISGERPAPASDDNISFHRRERETGSFRRVVALPGEIDRDNIHASCRDGILAVVLPKAEKEKPRKISINVR